MPLTVRKVSKVYSRTPKRVNGIELVSFTMLPGSCLAISGPSFT